MKTSTAVLVTTAVFGGGQAAFWLWHTSSSAPAVAENHQPTPAVASSQNTPEPRTIVSVAPQAASPSQNLVARSTTNPASSLYPKPSDYINGTASAEEEADPDAPMNRAELERRAQAVQQETQQRLETLTRDLNLTEDQQDYLFGVIAKSSPSYVPALNVGYYSGGTSGSSGGVGEFTPIVSSGSNGSNARSGANTNLAANTPNSATSSTTDSTRTVNDQVYEVLAEDQQDLLEEEILDRQRWWADIIDELEEEHDEIVAGTPVVTTPDTGTSDPDQEITTGEDGQTTEETHGGGNLFDNL